MDRESFISTIGSLSRVLRRSADRSLASSGISAVQAWVLLYIMRNAGAYQKDIERSFMMSRASVSGLIDTLERMGLVQRTAADSDKRCRRLIATEQGRKKIGSLEASLENLDLSIRESLGGDADAFLASCHMLMGSLEENLC